MKTKASGQSRERFFLTFLITAYMIIAVFILIASPILASRWLRTPFIGEFTTVDNFFFNSAPISPVEHSNLRTLGLGIQDRLIAIDNIEVKNNEEVNSILSNYAEGDWIALSIVRDGKNVITINTKLVRFSHLDQFFHIYIPMTLAVICFFCSVWVFRVHPSSPTANALIILTASITIVTASAFDFLTTQRLIPVFLFGVGLFSGSSFHLAMVLPRHRPIGDRHAWIRHAGYLPNLVAIGFSIFKFLFSEDPLYFLLPLKLTGIFAILFLMASISIFILQYATTKSLLIKQQSKTLLIITSVSAAPLLLLIVTNAIQGNLSLPNPTLISLIGLYPITATIVTLRFNLPQSSRPFTQIVTSLISLFVFAGAYTMVVIFLNLSLIKPVAPDNPWLIGGAIFLVIFAIEPLRRRISTIFKEISYRQPKANQEKALKYAAELTTTNDKSIAVNLLHDVLMEIITPKAQHIFLYHSETKTYQAEISSHPGLQIRSFSKDSALATILENREDFLYIQNINQMPAGLEKEQEKISELGAVLFLPISANPGMLGWVAIGPKYDETTFSARDINLSESMINQFSVAYQRIEAISETKIRLREMETLNQIAVAINTIQNYDDILTFIYHQIRNLAPVETFSLVMKTDHRDFYQKQFLIEDNQILISTQNPKPLEANDKENNYLDIKETKIIGEDQEHLIVPLFTEKTPIGIVCLSSRKPIRNFDHADIRIINAIANLITGAIIKNNILQNYLEQTKRLTTLNTLGQQISSTLAIQPLLNHILTNALQILECEAGSLLIADDDKNELVFEVTAGPVADTLRGHRMPDHIGFAGQSFTTQKPIIVNDVQKNPQWFEETDQHTGYDTRMLLVVPLIARGKPLGALEVLNKVSGIPFTRMDMDLLETFANQAAIAIENAWLYKRTDQALEKRVEELSLMQEIDRALNSSRDIDLALKVTLLSALSQTRLTFGTIGLIDQPKHRLRNIWHQKKEAHNPIKLPNIDTTDIEFNFEKDQHMIQVKRSDLIDQIGIANQGQYHFLMQIPLDEGLTAVLILHSQEKNALQRDEIHFLNRLIDHAAIALKGAILYEFLHDVIDAKNEFIRFISHELKNPLTAIKGYSDLLYEETVGEVNREQGEFLRTINKNVNRMNTFITDLSDQAQLETQSLRLVFSATNIYEIIDEVILNFGRQMAEKAIKIEKLLPENLPEAWCDRMRLIQILANLISNAIKYSPESGLVLISAEQTINQWDSKGAAEVIHFQVKDHGFGIASEDQDHIFEKFFRSNQARMKSIPGSGLGLIISKNLTEIMGGKMWFESEEGEGSTFHFTLPI